MWMYTLLPKVLNMSLTAGIVIVLVLLVRLLLKNAPKIFSYALWAVVLFRLLSPVSFSSDFSLLGLFNTPTVTENSITYIPPDLVHAEYLQVDLPVSAVSEAVNGTLPQGAEQIGADPLEAPMAIATLLWLSGIAVMLIYSVVSLLKLRRKLVGSAQLQGNIYLADHIKTPFVLGIIRPKIYLPSTLPEQEQGYIILHEQTHIKRLDHIIKLLAFCALAVHWFNPLVWLAFIYSAKDMELSCDERVIKEMGTDIKKAYSASLLSLATGRRIINGSPLAFGEGNTGGRIKNVLNYKKPAFWIVIAAFIACVTVSVCLLSNPKSNDNTSNEHPYAEQLFDYRTSDVDGDDAVESVINIVDLLEFPSDVENGMIKLTAAPETFSVVVNFTVSPETKAAYQKSEPENIEVFRVNACILFSLIKNTDELTFRLDDGTEEPAADLQFTRDWAESIVGADLWAESRTAERLDSLITQINEHVENAYAAAEDITTEVIPVEAEPEPSQTPVSSLSAAERAQAILDTIVSDGTVAMTLTTQDGVGGGRYEVDSSAGNGPNRVYNFTSSFDWSHAENTSSSAPESGATLIVASLDGTASIQCWQDSDLVLCTLDGETRWLSAGTLIQGTDFNSIIFDYLRFWYDEAEMSGLRGDIVIPDNGQSYEEIAQAWTDTYEGAMLYATPGSRFACTYVKSNASVNEEALDYWYTEKALQTEHFYFNNSTIFIPENDISRIYLMAGNTTNYEGRDAPEGAMVYWHMGPMYLTEDGWRCDGAGTGP